MNIEKRSRIWLDVIAIFLSFVGLIVSGFSAYYTCRTMQAAENQLMAAINLKPQFSGDLSRYNGFIVESDGKIQGTIIIRTYPYLNVTASSIAIDWDSYQGQRPNNLSLDYGVHHFSIPIMPAFEFYDIRRSNSRSGTLAFIEDSEYSSMLMEHLLDTKDYIEGSYGLGNFTASLEYFLELEYLDLLGRAHCHVYHVMTGFSEGVHRDPDYLEIFNNVVEPVEKTAETEPDAPTRQADSKTFFGLNAGEVLNSEPEESASEPVDLETSDIESIYQIVKKEIDSYLSISNIWWDWDEPIYNSTENSNRWHVLKIRKTDSGEDVYSNLVSAIQKQMEDNLWKYLPEKSD